jgi:2-keto-myo-inositol isomerase
MGKAVPLDISRFALNYMVAPRLGIAEFARLATSVGISKIEIRNDISGVPLADGTPAAEVRKVTEDAGVTILSINALQRFNLWDEARAEEARALARYAQECGAAALVLCPVNDRADRRGEAERARNLRTALRGLAPILEDHGIIGLVEPLGFPECSLRLKQEALDAIDDIGRDWNFALLHDTFHHFISGETAIFPERTGLVHISGVEDPDVPLADVRDVHRVLVGEADLIDNTGEIMRLLNGGYEGDFSYEPFAPVVHDLPDIAAALTGSMTTVRQAVG